MTNENNGLINRKYLGVLSEEFLETLKENGISSHEDLERMLGESFATKNGFIQLEERPSGLGVRALGGGIITSDIAHVMSYIIEEFGIPIEVRMNPKSKYSLITVKSIDDIEGYGPLLYDDLGNCIQRTRFEFSFNEVKKRLRDLTK